MSQYDLNDPETRSRIVPPNDEKRVLLHSCCAPCSGDVMETLAASGVEFSIFFYNPNIHPRDEYEIRKNENIAFARKMNIPFIDADYDRPAGSLREENWFKRARGLEWEPERGKRCAMCFDMRFERAALFAHENGFKVFTSSLGITRWKDMNQINACGMRAASHYPGMIYWTYNWRKGGGSQRMYEIAKREGFYQQEYCGCVYSLRDTNLWRIKNGKGRIERGTKFYGREARENSASSTACENPIAAASLPSS